MSGKRKDYSEAVNLYSKGLSIGEIASFYRVTRQAMHKILSRRNVFSRSNLRYGEMNHFYRGGIKANDKVHNLLEKAIKKMIIKRKTHCEECGDFGEFKDGRTKIQAHHSDYNKPLDVKWLCQKCHHEWHKRNKPNEIIKETKCRKVALRN